MEAIESNEQIAPRPERSRPGDVTAHAYGPEVLPGVDRSGLQIEEPRSGVYACTTIAIATALLAVAVAWAHVTPVPELARATAEILPAGLPRRIQFPKGGRVETVAVASGDRVAPGDLLVALSSDRVDAEHNQLRARRASLVLEGQRLEALLFERALALDIDPRYQHLALQQRVAYERQLANHADRKRTLGHEVSQREAEVERYESQARALIHRVRALEDKLRMLDSLRESGNIAEVTWIDTRADLAQVEAEYIQARGAAKAARSALQSARSRLAELDSELQTTLSLRASEVAAERTEVEQDIAGLQKELDGLLVRSPIRGIVKIAEFAGVNEVVGAGEVLMEIIPIADELVVHGLVASDDIGHLRLGQPARVYLDGFDRNRYGWLHGRVHHVSASTYLDEEGIPRFHAKIALERQFLGSPDAPIPLVPGMTGQIEISTGEKTVMAYLLKPILRGLQGAMHER